MANDLVHWIGVPELFENELSNEPFLEFLRTRSQLNEVTPYEHKAIFEILGEMAQFNPRFRQHVANVLIDFQYHKNAQGFMSRLAAAKCIVNGFNTAQGPYMVSLSELVGKALVQENYYAVRVQLFLAYKGLVNSIMQSELVRLRRSIE